MDYKRLSGILKNKDLKEIYYNDEPVWIQELKNDKATIGFINSNKTQDIFITDLYEKN